MRKLCFEAGGLTWLILLACGPSFAQPAPEVIRVDADAPARPFPHFWEQMFGSGHANLTMRQSWRDDLHATKAITDFRYVRFHDIFHDHNGVYSETNGREADLQLVLCGSDLRRPAGKRRAAVRRIELHALGAGRLAETAPVLVQAAAEPAAFLREMGELSRTSRDISRIVMERMRSGSGTSRCGTSRTSTSGRASQRRPPTSSCMPPPRRRSKSSIAGCASAARRRRRRRGSGTSSGIALEKMSRLISSTTHVYGNDTAKNVLNSGRGRLAGGDGGARGAEGVRRGQSLAATGPADHLVRI